MNEIDIDAPGLVHSMDGKGGAAMVEDGHVSLKMGADTIVESIPVHSVVAQMNFPDGSSAVETLSVGTKDGLLPRVTQDYTTVDGVRSP